MAMMRFCSLGSGSGGNALLLQWEYKGRLCHLLLDCGFSERELCLRLAERGVSIASLDAVLITHEHGDHLGKAPQIASRHGLELWASYGTLRSTATLQAQMMQALNYRRIRPGECQTLYGLEIEPVAVPHDAGEPLQFIFTLNPPDAPRQRLGVLTDLGHVSAHVLDRYRDLDALVVESNHDLRMLERSTYPPSLKQRVGGPWGHLSNQQSAQFLAAIDAASIPCVIAAHLSQQNNHPDHVRSAMQHHLGDGFAERLIIADQGRGFEWQIVRDRG